MKTFVPGLSNIVFDIDFRQVLVDMSRPLNAPSYTVHHMHIAQNVCMSRHVLRMLS